MEEIEEEEREISKIQPTMKGIINTHMIREDEEGGERRNNGGRYDKSQCYNCLKLGHFAWQCRNNIVEEQSNYAEIETKEEEHYSCHARCKNEAGCIVQRSLEWFGRFN